MWAADDDRVINYEWPNTKRCYRCNHPKTWYRFKL